MAASGILSCLVLLQSQQRVPNKVAVSCLCFEIKGKYDEKKNVKLDSAQNLN